MVICMVCFEKSMFKVRRTLEANNALAKNMSVTSPCGKFKIKCTIKELSYNDYSFCLLYPNPTYGERYEIGQIVQLHHNSENWVKNIKISKCIGNIVDADIIDLETFLICHNDDKSISTNVCEFLGYYTKLYRVKMDDFDKLTGNLFISLPNGEKYPVRLRWKTEDEICLQTIEKKLK